jgi:Taurine catabolism dioxygenase TauD, TfdA family
MTTLASSPPDLDALARSALEEIATRRRFGPAGPMSREEFEALLPRLGAISRNMDVVVSADREHQQRSTRRNNLPRPSIYQSGEMDFHTDPPPADLLAFYCVEQDDEDGSSLLIDLGHVEEDFTPDEVDDLYQVEVAYSPSNPEGYDGLGTLKLVTRHPAGATINYMPWGVRRPLDEKLANLLDRFEAYVRSRPVLSFRLKPGECLIIDNRRLLHGRGPLPPESKRHLLRVHVECPAS